MCAERSGARAPSSRRAVAFGVCRLSDDLAAQLGNRRARRQACYCAHRQRQPSAFHFALSHPSRAHTHSQVGAMVIWLGASLSPPSSSPRVTDLFCLYRAARITRAAAAHEPQREPEKNTATSIMPIKYCSVCGARAHSLYYTTKITKTKKRTRAEHRAATSDVVRVAR